MRVLLSSSEAVFKVQIKMRLSMQACRGPMMAPGRAVLQARGAKPVMVSRSRPGRSTLKVQAIGFDFGEQAQEPERKQRKAMANLGTWAASMLVLAPVMRGAVAEAFLGVIAASQKYQASNKDVLASYSKFYGLLLQAGYDSWQDYLLDQLLLGRDNALARAVAQGGLESGAPVSEALAHDLDVLQTLAVGLPSLAEYVGDMAPFAGAEWISSASTASLKRKSKKLGDGTPPAVSALNLQDRSPYISRPPTQDELAQWKATIANKEFWSEALPVVTQYWHAHGFGITSRNSALRWVKGALEEASDPSTPTANLPGLPAPKPLAHLSALEGIKARLDANTIAHCQGAGGQHVILAGPSGTGKSSLLWDATLATGRERGLRVVDVGSDVNAILEAARGCGRYPRVRFILVADHVELPLRGQAAHDLMAGLSAVGASGWPSNTLLYMGVHPTSPVTRDALVSRFGLMLVTKPLSEQEFGATLKELHNWHFDKPAEDVPPEALAKAAEWAKQNFGELTVRAAWRYLERVAGPQA